MQNNSSQVSNAMLDIAAARFFKKSYSDCEISEQLACTRHVLDFINKQDLINTNAL